MTRLSRAIVLIAIAGTQIGIGAWAQEKEPDVKALLKRIEELEQRLRSLETNKPPSVKAADPKAQKRIEELDQQVKIIERKRELEAEDAAVAAKSTPRLTAGASGFAFSSADTNFVLKIRGGAQTDARIFYGNNASSDEFLIRRVRPVFEGTAYHKFDYRIMLDIASGVTSSTANNGFLLDAYVEANLLPEFKIRAGKFKEPVGLERLQSWNNLLFLERNYPTQLVPNRDTGFMVHGELFDTRLQYQLGVFNGTTDGGSSDFDASDNDKDVAARVFATPFVKSDIGWARGLGFGVSGTIGDRGGAPRTYLTPGAQRFFAYRTGTGVQPNVLEDGQNWRVSPQAYYYWGPFGIFGEYVVSSHQLLQAGGGLGAGSREKLNNTAWQVAASYFLTGEENSWKAVAPKRPFGLAGGGWGAWELTARVGGLTVDDDAFPVFADPNQNARRAFSWGVGLNWHINRNVKIQLDYEQTTFSGGNANPLLSEKERAIMARVQFYF